VVHTLQTNIIVSMITSFNSISTLDGSFYWGDSGPKGNSHNPSYLPTSDGHNSDCDESLAVRSTALALMVYTERGEYMTEPIVRWLNSRRRSGWDTTVDTSMYYKKARLIKPTVQCLYLNKASNVS